MKEYCIQSKYNIRNVEFVIIIFIVSIFYPLLFSSFFFLSFSLSLSLSLSLTHVPYPSLYDYIVQGNV